MRRDASAVFAAALLIRIAFCFLVYPRFSASFSEGDGYDFIARNLVEGKGYTLDGVPAAAVRLPLVPLLYAGAICALGPSPWPWQLLQAAIGAATCALVLRFAAAHASRRGALIAAWFCALHPTMVLYTARPMTETVYVFLVTAFAALLLRRRGRGFAAGVALGAQFLVKSTALVSCLGLLPALLRGRAAVVRNAAASAVAVVLPWAVWNLASFGQPHVLAATGGLTFYHGLYISRNAGWFSPATDLNREAELVLWEEFIHRGVALDAPAPERDEAAFDAALRIVAAQPGATAALWGRNLLLTWYLTRSRASMLVHLLAHAALLAAAFIGARRLWGAGEAGRETAATLALLIVAYTVVHAVVHPAVRYILPAVPLAAVLAAAAFGLGAERQRTAA